MGIEYSAHLPSEFIISHLHQLLPDWHVPALSVLIVMQQSSVGLLQRTTETEIQKQQLRQRFIKLGQEISKRLRQQDYHAEIFDPKTGQPLLSQPGQMTLDDVAVVRSSLGYPLVETGGCWLIQHPNWGTGVFPGVLMSSAEPDVVVAIAHHITSSP